MLTPSTAHETSGPEMGTQTRRWPLSPRLLLLATGVLAHASATTADTLAFGSLAGELLAMALFLVAFACLIGALLLPARTVQSRGVGHRRVRAVLSGVVALGLALAVAVTVGVTVAEVGEGGSPRIYISDAAAFNAYNAGLVLRGQNPYTADGQFWDALRTYPTVGATPLRLGRYADAGPFGPSLAEQVVNDAKAEARTPAMRGPEFAPASLHSYPALAFLVYVPSVWAGLPTTMLTSLVFVGAFVLAAGWGAPRRERSLVALLLLANAGLVFFTLRGSFDVVALLPALLAWRTLDHPKRSAALLGLACAVKQIAWPLVPFYLVSIWRRDGARAALGRLAVLAGAFLVPNLPFLLASPGAWARSLLLPMALPIFPSGVGLVELARAGILPLWPSTVYAALEAITLCALLLWFARTHAARLPALGLLLGLLPLFVAWHSTGGYFVAIPALAVYAALPLLRLDAALATDAPPTRPMPV